MRDKWDRKTGGTTYGKMTVQKAIQDCHEHIALTAKPKQQCRISAKV